MKMVNVLIVMLSFSCLVAFGSSCQRCGQSMLEGDKFCQNCGKKYENSIPISYENSVTIRKDKKNDKLMTPLQLTLAGAVGLPGGFFDVVYGLEITALWSDTNLVRGGQIGTLNVVGDLYGFQIGGGSWARKACGVQIGSINRVDYLTGVQIGGFNSNRELSGLQIGVVNHVSACNRGFQIGLVNIIMDNQIPILPIVNWYL